MTMLKYKQGTLIEADWPAPSSVKAVVSTRRLGSSVAPYDAFNLADHVGDNADKVADNRQLLERWLGLNQQIQWLQQVHGTRVVDAGTGDKIQRADAIYTERSKIGCAVMTADCLPVFFCDCQGTKVAIAHAGWRGLAAGVLEATARHFREPMDQLMVYLGPAISQLYFETGPEVKDAFLRQKTAIEKEALGHAFLANPKNPQHDFTDLYQLARICLNAIGIEQVYGGQFCTFAASDDFYSYRREKVTGRIASVIFLDDQA